jgi:alkylhydroperoxidase family enzyme
MTSNTRVPKTEITGIYGALVKKMTRKMLGEVPEAAEVMWQHPAVFKDTMGLSRKVEKWNQCDENLKSFAHMAAVSLVGCSFCLDPGYFMAHNKGLDEAKAREVPRWRDSDVFTPLERDVMEYAEAMTQTPPTVTDEMSARLLKALGAPALVELTAVVALANLPSRMNTALGIESQEFSAACGLQPLATPSAVVVSSACATTRSSPTAACSSPSPTRCSAPRSMPRMSSRRPGCGGWTSTKARCGTRAPIWSGS